MCLTSVFNDGSIFKRVYEHFKIITYNIVKNRRLNTDNVFYAFEFDNR